MRKVVFAGRGFHFCEGDIEVRLEVYDFGLKLLSVGKNGKQGFFAPSKMGVCDDDARTGDEKSQTGFIRSFQIDDGGLGLADKFFERKLWLKADAGVGYFGGNSARKDLGEVASRHEIEWT